MKASHIPGFTFNSKTVRFEHHFSVTRTLKNGSLISQATYLLLSWIWQGPLSIVDRQSLTVSIDTSATVGGATQHWGDPGLSTLVVGHCDGSSTRIYEDIPSLEQSDLPLLLLWHSQYEGNALEAFCEWTTLAHDQAVHQQLFEDLCRRKMPASIILTLIG